MQALAQPRQAINLGLLGNAVPQLHAHMWSAASDQTRHGPVPSGDIGVPAKAIPAHAAAATLCERAAALFARGMIEERP